jgi:hypothetical protein
VITFGLSALPCSDGRTLGLLGTGLVDIPSHEVAEDLRRAALSTAFRRWAGAEERIPQVVWDADVTLSLTLARHGASLPGGLPVSLENGLRVGSHPDRMTSMSTTATTWKTHPGTGRAHLFAADDRAVCGAPVNTRSRVWGRTTRRHIRCGDCVSIEGGIDPLAMEVNRAHVAAFVEDAWRRVNA